MTPAEIVKELREMAKHLGVRLEDDECDEQALCEWAEDRLESLASRIARTQEGAPR